MSEYDESDPMGSDAKESDATGSDPVQPDPTGSDPMESALRHELRSIRVPDDPERRDEMIAAAIEPGATGAPPRRWVAPLAAAAAVLALSGLVASLTLHGGDDGTSVGAPSTTPSTTSSRTVSSYSNVSTSRTSIPDRPLSTGAFALSTTRGGATVLVFSPACRQTRSVACRPLLVHVCPKGSL